MNLPTMATRSLGWLEFGLPGLSPAQTRSLTATIARVRADAGDLDRAYGTAPNGIG